MAHTQGCFFCVFFLRKKEHIDDIGEPISGPTV
jgi:hypothetical protein